MALFGKSGGASGGLKAGFREMKWGEHPHKDMEIITYVLEGELEHRDRMGHGEVLGPGEVQRMTAGRGVMHSEYNRSNSKPVHLLQIWLYPEHKGLEPGYEQRAFPIKPGRAIDLLASSTGEGGSVRLLPWPEV